jgi:hypothetical protein
MKANELRIGNYVKHPRNDFAMVESIQRSAQGLYALTFKDEAAGYWIEHDGESICEGIPLTEDWLIKFGAFKETTNILILSRFKLIWKDKYKYWYVIDRNEETYYTKLEFLHEFQNLYFALNGEELKLSNK